MTYIPSIVTMFSLKKIEIVQDSNCYFLSTKSWQSRCFFLNTRTHKHVLFFIWILNLQTFTMSYSFCQIVGAPFSVTDIIFNHVKNYFIGHPFLPSHSLFFWLGISTVIDCLCFVIYLVLCATYVERFQNLMFNLSDRDFHEQHRLIGKL